MVDMFKYCCSLESLDLSSFTKEKLTSVANMFNHCTNLKTIPVLNFTRATTLSNNFKDCPSLTNEGLYNILESLATCVMLSGANRTLKYIGLSEEQSTICTTLSNWQALVDKNWTTGY
mgnify:CR=1 FL=1